MVDFFETGARLFWRLLLIFSILVGALAVVLLSGPKVYEARTLLLFKLGREYIYVPDTEVSGARAPDPGDFQIAVNAEMQILNSRAVKSAVVDRLGLAAIYPGLEEEEMGHEIAIAALSEAMSISLITGSYILRLGIHHEDPDTAALLANEIVAAYMKERQNIFQSEDADYIRAKMQQNRNRIDALELELADLLEGSDLLSFSSRGDTLIGENRTLREDLLEAQVRIAALKDQEALLQSSLNSIDRVVENERDFGLNPVVRDARTTVLALQAQYRAVTGQFGASHPDATALQREILEIQKLVEEEPQEVQIVSRTASNPLWLQARASLSELELQRAETYARSVFLQERLDENIANMAETSAKTSPVNVILDKLAVMREQYSNLYARLETTDTKEISESVDSGNIRIIEPAIAPLDSAGAPGTVKLMIAIVISFLITISYFAIYFFTKERILTADGVRTRLGVPVLGEIELRNRAFAV